MGFFKSVGNLINKVIDSEGIKTLKGTITNIFSSSDKENENDKNASQSEKNKKNTKSKNDNKTLEKPKAIGNCPNCGAVAKGKTCAYCGNILNAEEVKNEFNAEDGNYAVLVFLDDNGFYAEDVVYGYETDVYQTVKQCLKDLEKDINKLALENALSFKLVTKNDLFCHKQVQKYKDKGYEFKIKMINVKTLKDDINW